MKRLVAAMGGVVLGVCSLALVNAPRAEAQVPVLAPVILDTAAPIVVNAVKPKPKNVGLVKFEGTVLHANAVQVTAKTKGNDMAVQTFPLGENAAAKMQQIIDKGGYQYGDKITIYYDPQSLKAMNFKGKPSRPL